jgi:ribonuclease J
MAEKMTRRSNRQASDELVFVALGGLGEIGMNAYLYGLGPADDRRWLMVDLGITFPEGEDDPGIDVIMPDLRFIEENRSNLAGLVVTHAHEDHIGAVVELWPRLGCPVYATAFTAGMLKAKLAEYGNGLKMKVHEIELDKRLRIGPFDVELVSMAHSIPETSGLVLRTAHGTLFHTSDWKLDERPFIGKPTDTSRFSRIGDEGVLALICDSTNAMREGRSPSETDVAESLAKIIKAAPNRVAVTTFASNVARVRAVARAASAAGRQLVVAGRAMERVIDVAIDTGYLPEGFRYVRQQEFCHINRSDCVCLVTGSQGEPRAALARIAENEHPDVLLSKGDLVIFSSRTIPGNEKAVGHIQNSLVRMGCEVLTDNDALVHVTGHPRRDELRDMYKWIRPQIAVPMHGEARHLKEHAKLALECGAKEAVTLANGEILRIAPGPVKVVDDAPVGRLFRDGFLITGSEDGPVRERRKLAYVGVVMVSLAMNRKGEMLSEPLVVLDGVPAEDAGGEPMSEIVMDAVEGVFKSTPPARRRDVEMLTEAIRRSVRAAVCDAWGKKPVAKVLINVIEGR